MDRLESMSIFVMVVETGSLSATSRRLDMPLATVSRKVADLEDHLRTRLFSRSGRKLSLTDSGLAYLASCKRILEQVDDAERTAAGEYQTPRGELTITAPVVFGRLHVLPVVVAFLRAFPEIDIRLALVDRVTHLSDEHLDLALRIGNLPDSGMIATRLGSIHRVFCASPAYLLERSTPTAPEDLQHHSLIAFEGMGASPSQAWSFSRGGGDFQVPVRPRLSVTTAEAAIDAAAAGLGIARVLSYQIAEQRKAGTIVTILEEFEPAPWSVNFVYVGQGLLPLKLRAFLDFAIPRLRTRLS
ncbi:LysR family transcriptional regulator [Rhizobium sp. BK376]|uniref:LysR family transcriptional regulator n=1 Tax=Rhizobium sp. BK376 TaxID=2512149 RepID=UPI0010534CC1|nr:LysR family transcriptional regulator [Rhizobium sp. BK376]TCR91202.1 LysR family transcriptional regulator [Rhizobium sp. BK376]